MIYSKISINDDTVQTFVSDVYVSGLVEGIAQGDRSCLKNLYEIVSGKIYSVLIRIVKRHDLAEDILHDVFVTVWRKAGQFEPAKGQAMPWLYTIARRKAIDRLRSSTREGVGLHADAAGTETEIDTAPLWVDPELAMTVKRSLDGLPDHVTTALKLCYTAGFTHEEVASAMDVPLGTAKSWMRRGLAHLREQLTEHEPV